jgi:hypothetical protein
MNATKKIANLFFLRSVDEDSISALHSSSLSLSSARSTRIKATASERNANGAEGRGAATPAVRHL